MNVRAKDNKPLTKSYFAAAGLLFALVGIALAAFEPDIGSVGTKDETALERLTSVGARLIGGDDPVVSQPQSLGRYLFMGAGVLAIVMAAIGFLRHEHLRLVGLAAALGLVAVAWDYVLIAVGLAVLLVVISNLGFG